MISEKIILQRLERQCARAEYCTADVRRKALKALDGDADAAERVVASLLKDGYVDNLRYAGAFAREKASLQGWGRVKIAAMLRAKGIDRSLIEEALTEIEPEKASSRLSKLVAAKARTLQGDPAIRLKLLRFTLSRGYTYDEAAPAVEEVLS